MLQLRRQERTIQKYRNGRLTRQELGESEKSGKECSPSDEAREGCFCCSVAAVLVTAQSSVSVQNVVRITLRHATTLYLVQHFRHTKFHLL